MEHPAEGVRELAVGHRLRGRHVHRAGGGRGVEAEEDRPDHVVEVHPGHVLAPAGHRAAHAQLERRKHLLERPARLGQHHAGAGGHHAHAQLLGAPRLRLPPEGDLGEEVVRGRGRLVEPLVAAGAVPAAGGLRDAAWPAARPPGAPPARPRGCACRAHASRGSRAWRRRSSAARSARPPGAPPRRGRGAPRPGPARRAGPSSRRLPRRASRRRRSGERDSTVTSSPRSTSARTRAAPIIPVAPVTTTFTTDLLVLGSDYLADGGGLDGGLIHRVASGRA